MILAQGAKGPGFNCRSSSLKERHDWRSACRQAGARTIISTFSLKGLRGEYRMLPRSVVFHAFGLLLSVCVCMAVRCAVVVFVDSVKVCIQHSGNFPPFCPVFCSDARNACDAIARGLDHATRISYVLLQRQSHYCYRLKLGLCGRHESSAPF